MLGACPGEAGWVGVAGSGGGQRDVYFQAAVWPGGCGGLAAVGFGYGCDDGQAEPGLGGLACPGGQAAEWLE